MKDKIYTIVFMTVLCAVATLLMAGAKLLMAERVKENETLRENRARLTALDLLPEKADARAINELVAKRVRVEKRDGRDLFLAFEADGKTQHSVGVAFTGPGFWGPIRGMISADPQGKEIRGIVFSDHGETPGLGGRINEPWFTAQFRGKSAVPDATGGCVTLLPEGTPASGAHEVNAISGATRTSDSVRLIVNAALKELRAALDAPAAPAPGGK
jgi:Na+-transporting NADH:ubiquinone oxidoreductase subunit C